MTGEDNTIAGLNEIMFKELRRLDQMDADDADALHLEIQRAKAIDGLAKTTVDSMNTALETARLRAEYAGTKAMQVPRMIAG